MTAIDETATPLESTANQRESRGLLLDISSIVQEQEQANDQEPEEDDNNEADFDEHENSFEPATQM